MTFSENKEINDVISQGLFRGNESALAVLMLETLKLSKKLKSSRDDFNVLHNFNVSSIKMAIVILF